MNLLRHLVPLACAPLLATAIPAQAATLTNRLTNVFGNFLVGAGPVGDSGSFSEFLTAPLAASYGRDAADAGAVNGVLNGQPVVGSASFASSASYSFGVDAIVGSGRSATAGDTPYDYVSLGANASSAVRLDFRLTVPTHVVLTGAVTSLLGPDVGSRRSGAQASVSLNGVGSWVTTSHQGGFEAARTLLPGSYSLRGNSSAQINGESQFSFNLLLTPVPEPSSAALLAAGIGALVVLSRWRRSLMRGIHDPA